MKRCVALVLLFASMACSGSSGSSSTTTPTPTSPPLPPTSETFTGTVSVGGSATHSFIVALTNGQLTATLTAAGPPSTISMGLAVGTFSNSVCTQLTGGAIITAPGPAPQLQGSVPAGAYCVMVFDAGNQPADVTYSVTVTHY